MSSIYKPKFKVIYGANGGDGDLQIEKDGEIIFYDHEHNLDAADLISMLGFEVEIVNEYE